jgi:hypothetical protein
VTAVVNSLELTSRLYEVCAALASAERSNANDADRTIDRALSALHHIIEETEQRTAADAELEGCELACGREATHPDGLCHECHEAWHDSLDEADR